MSVFKPSLPPDNSTTTSARSLRLAVADASAARVSSDGIQPLKETAERPTAPCPRNFRRVSMWLSSTQMNWPSAHVILGQTEQRRQRVASPLIAESGIIAEQLQIRAVVGGD